MCAVMISLAAMEACTLWTGCALGSCCCTGRSAAAHLLRVARPKRPLLLNPSPYAIGEAVLSYQMINSHIRTQGPIRMAQKWDQMQCLDTKKQIQGRGTKNVRNTAEFDVP
jgi:hypothetical protein